MAKVLGHFREYNESSETKYLEKSQFFVKISTSNASRIFLEMYIAKNPLSF